jgi:hypothetical protein
LWESRTSPDFFYKKGRFHERPFFILSTNYFDLNQSLNSES